MAHRPDGRTSAASNFLIRLSSVQTVGDERPDHDRQSSGRLKSNRQFPSLMHTRPDQSCQTSGRSYLNCDSCLTETRVRTGYHISSKRLIDLPFLGTWIEIKKWSSTGRRPDMLLKCPDGCKRAQKLLDTVWGPDGMNTSSGRMMLVCLASGRDDTSSGRMEQWTDGRPNGMAQSSGRLTRNLNFFWLADSK
jgi:hypothetical protein